ncbi:MAG: homoserine kinase [Bacteroidales bacterium]
MKMKNTSIIKRTATVFAPATVANVGCGFDIMGFALDDPGDKVTITIADTGSCHLTTSGPYGQLVPVEPDRNTAAVAVASYLGKVGTHDLIFDIHLEKNMPLGSGMGSSAASAAAAVYAINYLLDNPLSVEDLVIHAMEGERVACGTAHADNVAPSLLGGFLLIRSHNPPDIVKVTCPRDLYCALVHPHIELKTSDARRILRSEFPLGDVTRQTANTAAFMTGLLTGDYGLIARSVDDFIAEPRRIMLIPGFEAVRKAALDSGALSCSISGSGPSLFSLCRGRDAAERAAIAMQAAFERCGLASDLFISTLNEPGARTIVP